MYYLLRLLLQLVLITNVHAIINSHHVTTLSWTQAQAAYVCIYSPEVLLFCDDFAAGNHTVLLGTKGPLVAHVVANDTLHLETVGETNTTVLVSVEQIYERWMPIMRR